MGIDHPQFGTFCGICFKGLTWKTCAEDVDGVKWDLCPGQCAQEAGIEEKPAPEVEVEVDAAMRVVGQGEADV